jgi:glucose/arabinose dehydrogenase
MNCQDMKIRMSNRMNTALVKTIPRWSLILLLALCASTCIAEEPYRLEVLATSLDQPLSLVFLPDGTALVTELPGNLRRIGLKGEVGEPWKHAGGSLQPGDCSTWCCIRICPQPMVYLALPKPTQQQCTTVARGRLQENRLENVRIQRDTAQGNAGSLRWAYGLSAGWQLVAHHR